MKYNAFGACERKKRAFFVLFILSEGKFFKICILSQCIVHWIHFLNIHTFTYQTTILYTLYFLNKGFKLQPNVCNRCHDLLMMSLNLSDITI